MRNVLPIVFGGHAQVAVGAACFLTGVAAWLYWTFVTKPTVNTVFHLSMFFGLVACYAIVATGLGYRATERVEQYIIEDNNVEN